MSEAGDDIQVEEPQEEQQVEVTATDAPKGKLSVEEALQVLQKSFPFLPSRFMILRRVVASFEERPRSRRPCPGSS
jgi:hypothetical protein